MAVLRLSTRWPLSSDHGERRSISNNRCNFGMLCATAISGARHDRVPIAALSMGFETLRSRFARLAQGLSLEMGAEAFDHLGEVTIEQGG